jgi:hypothetical protein
MSSGIRVSGMDNTFSYPFCKYPQISNATRTCTHGYRLIPEPVYNGFFIRGHADNGYPLPSLPTYRLKSKTKSKTYYHMSPQLQTLPPCLGGLRRCHVLHGSGPRLLVWEGSGATTCPAALDHASLLRRAPMLPCAPWLWTLPPYLGGFQCCHMPHDFRVCLLVREGFDAATCPAALNGS